MTTTRFGRIASKHQDTFDEVQKRRTNSEKKGLGGNDNDNRQGITSTVYFYYRGRPPVTLWGH